MNSGCEIEVGEWLPLDHSISSPLTLAFLFLTLSSPGLWLPQPSLNKACLPASRLPLPHGVMAGEVLQTLHSTGLVPLCLHKVWERTFREKTCESPATTWVRNGKVVSLCRPKLHIKYLLLKEVFQARFSGFKILMLSDCLVMPAMGPEGEEQILRTQLLFHEIVLTC